MGLVSAVEQYLSSGEGQSLDGSQRELVRRMALLYGVEPTTDAVCLLGLAVRSLKKKSP